MKQEHDYKGALEDTKYFLEDIGRGACISGWANEHYSTLIAALQLAINPWRPVSEAKTGWYIVWVEYKDRSGTGYQKHGFFYEGKWDVKGFEKWDYEHTEITQIMDIPRDPPAPEREE